MTDITELFRTVSPAVDEPSDDLVDADVARGRFALSREHRRRRIRRSGLAAAAVVAAFAVVVFASHGSGSSQPTVAGGHPKAPPVAASHSTKKQTHKKAPAIKLVAYNGKQLQGFTVDKIPAGWFLGGVSQYALTINPAGDRNLRPDVFEGKLTVLLASKDETSFPKNGTQVTVNGQPGVIWDEGGVQLGYADGAGHRLDIEVPSRLGWSDDQIVAFAEGVHVTTDALAGVG
jgi:hypothetical protein